MIYFQPLLKILFDSRHFFYRAIGLFLILLGSFEMKISDLIEAILSYHSILYWYLCFVFSSTPAEDTNDIINFLVTFFAILAFFDLF